jgi:hypothetical protein
LLIANNANLETGAVQVGYESASQSGRKYTRVPREGK